MSGGSGRGLRSQKSPGAASSADGARMSYVQSRAVATYRERSAASDDFKTETSGSEGAWDARVRRAVYHLKETPVLRIQQALKNQISKWLNIEANFKKKNSKYPMNGTDQIGAPPPALAPCSRSSVAPNRVEPEAQKVRRRNMRRKAARFKVRIGEALPSLAPFGAPPHALNGLHLRSKGHSRERRSDAAEAVAGGTIYGTVAGKAGDLKPATVVGATFTGGALGGFPYTRGLRGKSVCWAPGGGIDRVVLADVPCCIQDHLKPTAAVNVLQFN